MSTTCKHCGKRIYQTAGAKRQWVHHELAGGEHCYAETVAEPDIPEKPKLSPLQDMVMEVLVARYRLGENVWTFPYSVKKTVVTLAALPLSLVDWKPGVVENTILVWLTELGRKTYLDDDYEAPTSKQFEEKVTLTDKQLGDLGINELRELAKLFDLPRAGNMPTLLRHLSGRVTVPPNGIGTDCRVCGMSNTLCWHRIRQTGREACCSTCRTTDTHGGK